ncbi:hypothetical protein EVAR_77785_1 [Eumeta japonica]|uniref:Uncharacterized protein n=1 Tax=Eumeta variegata TaxID=151549 RepID=A0A4C1TB15_EUMVA|nr:hypothetical protein EVAR_77785_1 [Eumeta japonica]
MSARKWAAALRKDARARADDPSSLLRKQPLPQLSPKRTQFPRNCAVTCSRCARAEAAAASGCASGGVTSRGHSRFHRPRLRRYFASRGRRPDNGRADASKKVLSGRWKAVKCTSRKRRLLAAIAPTQSTRFTLIVVSTLNHQVTRRASATTRFV